MTERNDSLVGEYLTRVSRATANLPSERRDELIRDLREHIETSRSELSAETEAEVRQILERLGDPTVIARAAAEDAGLPVGRPEAGAMSGRQPAAAKEPTARRRRHLWLAAAIVGSVLLLALCAGALFFAKDTQEGAAMTTFQR